VIYIRHEFVCNLYNDAASNSDDKRQVFEKMQKHSVVTNLRYYPRKCLENLEKSTKKSQFEWSTSRPIFESGTSEYKWNAFPLQQTCSVWRHEVRAFIQHLHPSHPVGMQPNSLLIADLKQMLMDLFLTLFSLARNMHWTAFNFLLLVYFCILIHITLRFALHHETFQFRHFTCRHNHAVK
jgi:hypothetical protein